MKHLKNRMWRLFLASLAFVPFAAQAYTHEVGGIYVGMIRAYGNNAGVQAFRRADGGTFPGCTNDPTYMWSDSAYVTADGSKALLAVLLSARALNAPVKIYYTTASGYCLFQIIDIE